MVTLAPWDLGSSFSSWDPGSFLWTEPPLGDLCFSLERDIMLSVRQAREREELNHLISEKEEALRDLELETAKLVRRCLEKDSVMHFAGSPPLSLSFPGDHHCWSLLCLWKSQLCLWKSQLSNSVWGMMCSTWGRDQLCSQILCVGPLSLDGISVAHWGRGFESRVRFVSFTSFFPQEKNKEILSRSVVEVQKEVRWALHFFLGGGGGPRIISPLLKGGSFLNSPNRVHHLPELPNQKDRRKRNWQNVCALSQSSFQIS